MTLKSSFHVDDMVSASVSTLERGRMGRSPRAIRMTIGLLIKSVDITGVKGHPG